MAIQLIISQERASSKRQDLFIEIQVSQMKDRLAQDPTVVSSAACHLLVDMAVWWLSTFNMLY